MSLKIDLHLEALMILSTKDHPRFRVSLIQEMDSHISSLLILTEGNLEEGLKEKIAAGLLTLGMASSPSFAKSADQYAAHIGFRKAEIAARKAAERVSRDIIRKERSTKEAFRTIGRETSWAVDRLGEKAEKMAKSAERGFKSTKYGAGSAVSRVSQQADEYVAQKELESERSKIKPVQPTQEETSLLGIFGLSKYGKVVSDGKDRYFLFDNDRQFDFWYRGLSEVYKSVAFEYKKSLWYAAEELQGEMEERPEMAGPAGKGVSKMVGGMPFIQGSKDILSISMDEERLYSAAKEILRKDPGNATARNYTDAFESFKPYYDFIEEMRIRPEAGPSGYAIPFSTFKILLSEPFHRLQHIMDWPITRSM